MKYTCVVEGKSTEYISHLEMEKALAARGFKCAKDDMSGGSAYGKVTNNLGATVGQWTRG